MNKLISALVAIAITLAPGCSWLRHTETVVKQDVIDCAKQDLGQTITESGVSLLMTVVAIIATGGTNWQADLSALESKYGGEALACAEKITSDIFKPAATASPSTGSETETPFSRAEQALAKTLGSRQLKQ